MLADQTARLAVVTGANRGIGREVARQLADRGLDVIIGARDDTKARAAADRIGADSHQLDVADDDSVAAFTEWLSRRSGIVKVMCLDLAGKFYCLLPVVNCQLQLCQLQVKLSHCPKWQN